MAPGFTVSPWKTAKRLLYIAGKACQGIRGRMGVDLADTLISSLEMGLSNVSIAPDHDENE
jgi:hypothetical protein